MCFLFHEKNPASLRVVVDFVNASAKSYYELHQIQSTFGDVKNNLHNEQVILVM
jgi:hypothetical protein